MLRKHAFDSVLKRWLFSVHLDSASETLDTQDLPAGNFACLLAWDALRATADEISSLVEPLLKAGASYFVCWGPDCQRVHDVIDEMVAHPDAEYGVPPDACIMTTWHDSEPLAEALWFFLFNTWPDEHYQESTRSGLAISVGSAEWAAEINAALSEPREFVRRGSEDGA